MIARRTPIRRSTKPLPKKRKPRAYKTPRCDYATPTGRRPCKKPQAVTWEDALAKPGEIRFTTGPLAGRTGTVYAEVRGMCVSHAKLEAHRRVSAFVRARDGGRCVIPHADLFPCAGPWQPNHGFDRDEKSCTYAEWNVFGGCGAINTWAHHNKFRWYERLRALWGEELYEQRRQVVLNGAPMELADVLAKYPGSLHGVKEQEARVV